MFGEADARERKSMVDIPTAPPIPPGRTGQLPSGASGTFTRPAPAPPGQDPNPLPVHWQPGTEIIEVRYSRILTGPSNNVDTLVGRHMYLVYTKADGNYGDTHYLNLRAQPLPAPRFAAR